MFHAFCWWENDIHEQYTYNRTKILETNSTQTTANSSGQNKVNFSPVASVDEENPHVELTSEEDLKTEITELKVTIASLEEDFKDKIKKLSEKDEIIAKSKFCIDRFKHNQVHFKFYTGFDSYGQFKYVLEYLQPAASMLSWESGSTPWQKEKNIDKNISSLKLVLKYWPLGIT